MKKKTTIGRRDKASFPEFGLKHLDVKIDTGAYTSAIHCHKIEIREIDGTETLVFGLLDPSHPQYNHQEFYAEKYREKRIKNSFGITEKRFVLKTDILIFGRKSSIELSLSRRGEMKYPILIGRKFLMGKFIVDPSKYDLSYKSRKNKLINKKR